MEHDAEFTNRQTQPDRSAEFELEARASAEEFDPAARESDFEIERAKAAYIPLLEACYALANQRPVALPDGYESLGEIRADMNEMAMALEADPPVVHEAVRNDIEASQAAAIDPSAFGFVVREQATAAVLVCIRGTQTPSDWLRNFTAIPNPFSEVPGFGAVHLGFERLHRTIRGSIQTGLSAVAPATRITVLGHSLGGAMGILAAVDLKRNFGRTNVDVCTFGGPRVGKVIFRRNFNREIAACFRITNQFDIVPHVPSVITGWNHVGDEIEVDGDVESPHSLQAYLQGLRNIGSVREFAPAAAVVPLMGGAAVVSVRLP